MQLGCRRTQEAQPLPDLRKPAVRAIDAAFDVSKGGVRVGELLVDLCEHVELLVHLMQGAELSADLRQRAIK
ncbi:MAG TPA: hypothetical protein VN603_13015 [Candidatus Acidoferrales bacterium]|nr:hypothetical protein [Candidatus Acidoferrales bacterium]